MAQGLYGDIKDYMPDRPSAIDPLERLKWDYWAKLDGMSKDEAQKLWLETVIPLMDKQKYDWTNPRKAEIDKKYNKCVEEQLAEGKTKADI